MRRRTSSTSIRRTRNKRSACSATPPSSRRCCGRRVRATVNRSTTGFGSAIPTRGLRPAGATCSGKHLCRYRRRKTQPDARGSGRCHTVTPKPAKDRQLAKPNYAFAKRQRDLAKKQKQEEKRKRKEELKAPPAGEAATPTPDDANKS